MAKGREKSDGRIVPQGRRKAPRTVVHRRGGKAATESQHAGQLELSLGTADSPRGADGGADRGRPLPAPRAVPKPRRTKGIVLRPMTLEEVADRSNLRVAFERVASNKGAPGPDGQSVARVREHLDEVLDRLHTELLSGDYRPGHIRRVWIPKSGGGERGLGIPDVIDRTVQQAVHQVLSPHYEPTFHPSSHGFRPGRSCHTAIAEARKHLEEGFEWVVDLDLSKFFDRVPHDRLLGRLAQRVSDARVVGLIRRMLKAKVVLPEGVVVSTEEGTPQGGPLSPLLSNIVLDELDRELDRRGHRFVRYADDCNIYVRSERSGHRVMGSVVRFIEGRLRLMVNADKSAVARPEERHFLGFRLRRDPEEGEVEVLLSARSKERIDEKIRELTPRTFGQSIRDCIAHLNVYLRGWVGFFWILTETGLSMMSELDAHIRRRLRAIQLRQWKRPRTILAKLIGAGVKPKDAGRYVNGGRKSIWTMSHRATIYKVLPNRLFAEWGLVSLADERSRLQKQHVIGPVQLALRLE